MMIRSKVQALSLEVSDDYCTAAQVRETPLQRFGSNWSPRITAQQQITGKYPSNRGLMSTAQAQRLLVDYTSNMIRKKKGPGTAAQKVRKR